MKGLTVLLAAAALCGSLAHADTVTLTRNDVADASDIQWAIYRATHFGTTSGKVVFDGGNGPFASASEDLDIRVPVSNLTLAGIHGATIASCKFGLAFLDASVRNVLVEGMRFECRSFGDMNIGVVGENVSGVTIRNNVFDIDGHGVVVRSGSGWKFQNNVIKATTFDAEPAHAMELLQVSDSDVSGNSLTAPFGLRLASETAVPSSGNRIVGNRVVADWRGLFLDEATQNLVLLNVITLTTDFYGQAILLSGQSSGNRVQLNRAILIPGDSVNTVVDEGRDNKVSGNRP